MSIGGHQSANMGKDEWLTPPEVIKSLGMFDLDPCSPRENIRPWPTATKHFDNEDDGLSKEWQGRVWCNPPYGLEAAKWLNKLKQHGNGVALIFARTETKMFFDHVWEDADSVFFFKGRIYFHHVDGSKARANAGAPSVLIAYGKNNTESIRNSGLSGKLVVLSN